MEWDELFEAIKPGYGKETSEESETDESESVDQDVDEPDQGTEEPPDDVTEETDAEDLGGEETPEEPEMDESESVDQDADESDQESEESLSDAAEETDDETDTEDLGEEETDAEAEVGEETESAPTPSEAVTISGNTIIFPEEYDLSTFLSSAEDSVALVQAVDEQTDVLHSGFSATNFLLGLIAGGVLIQSFRLSRF